MRSMKKLGRDLAEFGKGATDHDFPPALYVGEK